MAKEKNIILTFDYELFLGSRSGTVENCLLIPTNKLLEIFTKYNIKKGIFFVDTTYLLKLKKQDSEDCRNDYKKIVEQLTIINKQGHYLYPHLHPHWLDAVYLPDTNQWDLSNTKRYSFSAIKTEEREMLFAESIKILEEIRGQQSDLGYRAGGWCIEPFADYKPFFQKHGIRYDFSVMNGYSCTSKFQTFDFRNTPRKSFYRFNDKTNKEVENGEFIEIPITNIKIRIINRLLNRFFIKLLYRKGISNYGDGYSAHSASLKEISPYGHEMASLELLTITNINDYLKHISKNPTLQLISHPKMLNPHNLTCLDVLLKKLFDKYDVNSDFKKAINFNN